MAGKETGSRGIRLADLAAALGLDFEGDPDLALDGLAPLGDAGPTDLSFIRSDAYADALAVSRAGAVIALPSIEMGGRPALRAADPGREFQRAARLIAPAPTVPAGVHASAVVADDARVDATAAVGPACVIGSGVRVGPGSVLHPGVVLYDGVTVGAGCVLYARVVVAAEATLGDRVILHHGVVVGGDGFGYTGGGGESGGRIKTHDVGSVVLGDDVEIGANSTVDRGTLGDTRVGRGTKIDNLVMIAHNCQIGEDVLIAAQVGIAGSSTVEHDAVLLGQVGIAGHVTIGAHAFLAAKTGVTKDVPANANAFGYPHRTGDSWHKEHAALRQLPRLVKRVRALERREKGTAGDDA